MSAYEDTVVMRVFGDVPLAAMAEPLVTAIGARGGLDIARLDELVAAVDVVARSMPIGEARTLEAGRDSDGVHVLLAPVDAQRVSRSRAALDALVTAVRVGEGEVRLQVGG